MAIDFDAMEAEKDRMAAVSARRAMMRTIIDSLQRLYEMDPQGCEAFLRIRCRVQRHVGADGPWQVAVAPPIVIGGDSQYLLGMLGFLNGLSDGDGPFIAAYYDQQAVPWRFIGFGLVEGGQVTYRPGAGGEEANGQDDGNSA